MDPNPHPSSHSIPPPRSSRPETTGPASLRGSDHLAWALTHGWMDLPQEHRRLTSYVIESGDNLPWSIRLRDILLMVAAWIAWGAVVWQTLGRHIHAAGTSDELLARLEVAGDLALGGISFAALLLLFLAPFCIYSFYRSRKTSRTIPEPGPLATGEISAHCHLPPASVLEWQRTRHLRVKIGEEGLVESYDIAAENTEDEAERRELRAG